MGCAVIVIRAARPSDRPARLRLIQDTLAETYYDAFLYFFFQELTLQALVLCGAVLFIFCGVSVAGCALLLPAAAAIVVAAVRLHAAQVASNAQTKLSMEEAGWVCESHGPLRMAGENAPTHARIVAEDEYESDDDRPVHKEIIGSISVSEVWGDPAAWFVWGLAVERGWRRRGAGGALLGAVRGAAQREGKAALRAALSHLQTTARGLMHKHGWECRGTYHRALLGAALTLPMAQLSLELPYA